MSETKKADLITERSKMLATVVLTRRLNIDVLPFGTVEDMGIDLIGTIRPDEDEPLQGFLPFAVVVWGTTKELHNENEATRYARSHKKLRTGTTFFMPVVVLLFSMLKDEAYFAWLVKPCKESGKLLHEKHLKFSVFGVAQLDKMTTAIKRWYGRISHEVVADAGELDSSQCLDDSE
ncbi:MAG TPA: hypothetical protein VMG10_21530 [Gemmataceae bacterium]|nr:hypothetical protein [Gemmataceae bacterium]